MNKEHDFDDAFRRWAWRPLATSGADAARAVVEHVAAKGRRRFDLAGHRLSAARATLALAIVAIVAGTATFIRSLPPAAPVSVMANPAPHASAVPAREADIVLWLDAETPVYVFLPDGN